MNATEYDGEAGKLPQWARREQVLLAPYAMFSIRSAGRRYPEPSHPYRSPFQRDRDRILHSAAFRRLSGKMQVFTGDMGDYHRTRLTHTHEVATIARTIGRVFRLNEDLIEALALVHDIGHPPFGHSGEEVLNACLQGHGGFSHNQFALTLVDELEVRYTEYPGLNLSQEILDGQVFRITHRGQAPLLEVQVVDWADSIAYNAHDADDALKLGLLQMEQLQSLPLVRRALAWTGGAWRGENPSEDVHERLDSETRDAEARVGDRQDVYPTVVERQKLVHHLIDVQVNDLLETARPLMESLENQHAECQAVPERGVHLNLSPEMSEERSAFSKFLFANVYRHPQLVEIRKQAAQQVETLFHLLVEHPGQLPDRFRRRAEIVGTHRAVGEYIGGTTDRFFGSQYQRLVVERKREAADWD